ncbi:hypothetical protein [uncultured Roseibium sp.]|uniref:hypothetical protein n=1 Tax=uncultured Roseibium sp. TaxID=1936171 RepID=UPI0032170F69
MTMLPRLQAEERMGAISIGLLSSGYADKKDVTHAMRRLQAIAGGGRRKAAAPTPETLAAVGIEMVIVPPGSNTAGEAGEPGDG